MSEINNMPRQMLSFKKKNEAWMKKCVDWGDSKSLLNYNPVRRSVRHKKVNYDLINGILHMDDMELIFNPGHIKGSFIPDKVQHYPIMNSKINVLIGEEIKRVFDYRVTVTNPNAVSEIENEKKEALFQAIEELMKQTSLSEDEFNQKLEKISDYFTYEWQDLRELRANALLKHYVSEYNMPNIFNAGFKDALIVGEEIYSCDIVGGEPVLEKLDNLKVRVYRSGYSNRVEDADVITIEDYWSPGKIIDTYYNKLSKKDMEYIESIPYSQDTDSMGNIDERNGFVNRFMVDETFEMGNAYTDLFGGEYLNSLAPYDSHGNIRVLKVFWKSKRKIKRVKSHNMETGEVEYNFYPENYVLNEAMGEEEDIYFINEAWEGVKIGKDIYVNMGPRPIQYNRLSNPSRCHFGIIGTIYNINNGKPFSLVDMMKPYNYYYDLVHDRLNKMLSRNWGKLLRLDLAKVPSHWEMDKWIYYAKAMGIAVENSFEEGKKGAATGTLAGAMNNASSGVIDAEFGNSIQAQITLLEYIKNEMSEVAGISKQREGQISNRETVGGVERATLQSSYITEYLFAQHEDTKRRVLECFLETAKIALAGKSKKFEYILSDATSKMINIDGDEFAECDYGLVVSNDSSIQELSQKLDVLAQAALQNQTLSFSTIMKLYSSNSIAEKMRMVERDEKNIMERAQQQQQEQLQQQQQALEANAQQEQAKMSLEDNLNQRDNETKILIAQINASSKDTANTSTLDEANLQEKIREFDAKLALDKEKLNQDMRKHKEELEVKKQSLAKKNTNTK